jgi:hypothetical protein
MVALEDLKRTNEIITSSFKNDLEILQSQHKALTTDHEQQKTQLIDALLSKDKLMKDLASFKERTGTNGDDAYQKAQSEAIIEEENARKALQEVSKVIPPPESPSPAKKGRGFLKTLSRLSFLPYTTRAQPTRPEPASEPVPEPVPEPELVSDQATLGSPENLEREYGAVGITRAIPRPPRLSFHPYTSSAQATGRGPTPEPDQASLDILELTLQRERSIFGGVPAITRPLISPRTIPLPASPIRPRSERTDLKRCTKPRGFDVN